MRPNALPLPDLLPVIETVTEESQEIIQLSADYHNSTGYRQQSLREVIVKRVDGLITLFLDNFADPITPAQSREVMSRHYPLTPTALSKIDSATIPIVVMRELISIHRVTPERSTLWAAFTKRYNRAVT